MLLIVSCESPTKVKIPDYNNYGVYYVPPGMLGLVSLYFVVDPDGSNFCVVRNYNAIHAGLEITNDENYNEVYVCFVVIPQGESDIQENVIIPLNTWVRVRSVIYESGTWELLINLIQLIGLDKISEVEDWMIAEETEILVYMELTPEENLKIIKEDDSENFVSRISVDEIQNNEIKELIFSSLQNR